MPMLTTLLWALGLIVVPLTAVVCACTQAAAAWERREDLGQHLSLSGECEKPQAAQEQHDACGFGKESAEGARVI